MYPAHPGQIRAEGPLRSYEDEAAVADANGAAVRSNAGQPWKAASGKTLDARQSSRTVGRRARRYGFGVVIVLKTCAGVIDSL